MTRFSDTTVRRIGQTLILVSMAGALGALVTYLSIGEASRLLGDWAIHNIMTTLAFGTVVLLGLRSQPRHGAVWAILWTVVFGALQATGATTGLAIEGISNADIQAQEVTVPPSALNPVAALGFQTALWAWVPALFIFATHVIILFPSGRLPSPRWRWATWTAAIAMGAAAVTFALPAAPWSDTPYNEFVSPDASSRAADGAIAVAALGTLVLLGVISLVGLILRYRSSSGEERLQYRWGVWGLGILVVSTVIVLIDSSVFQIVSLFVIVNGAISYGIAITRYGLHGIDVVISRAVVYGSLAVFIGAVYVALVVGVGELIGSGDEPNAGLAIAATAIVAVAFQPLRRRLERVANRLVYGRRATPYEVLSDFSRRVAATDDTLLGEAARSLVDGTGAEHAAVWVAAGGRLVMTAEWPEGNGDPRADVTSFPITQDGAELGMLTLSTPHGQRLPEEDHRLATEVASGMGLALRNQVLTESLQARVEELRESRRRLVAVQDETRRKLERDLHDGAQQQLVALKVKLGLARAIAHKDGAGRTADMLEALATDADEAVDAMRDFARGVYPPLLEAEGLGPAIAAQARRAPFPVTVEADGIGRFPRDVEATVYFCVLEALQNTAKYANATSSTVRLHQANGALSFTVSDDGAGFDPTAAGRGAGITNMEDRLDAAGGSLTITSGADGGTTVSGTVPAAPVGGITP